MVKILTAADSPLTLTPEQFTNILNLKPDVNLLCQGGAYIKINLPLVSELPSGFGQLLVQVTDKTTVEIECAPGDLFVSANNNNQIVKLALTKDETIVITATINNRWLVQ